LPSCGCCLPSSSTILMSQNRCGRPWPSCNAANHPMLCNSRRRPAQVPAASHTSALVAEKVQGRAAA
jgi:hypothetical protein